MLPTTGPQIDPVLLGARAVLPALTVAVAILPWAWRKRGACQVDPDGSRAWALPLALGLGLFASYVGIHGWPPAAWYPDMKARLAWAGVAAGLFGLAQARLGLGRWAHLIFLGLCAFWLLWHWQLRGMWPPVRTAQWLLGWTLVVWVQTALLERVARRGEGPALPLLLCAGCCLSALVFLWAHAQSHARLAAGLASVLGLAGLVAFWRPRFSMARGGIATFALLYSGLALANHLTADLPSLALGLILVAPLGTWIATSPLLFTERPLLRVLLALLAVLLPVILAAWSTHAANPPYGVDDYLNSY